MHAARNARPPAASARVQVGARQCSLYSSVAERQSCKLKVLGPILSGGYAQPSAARKLVPWHVEGGFMRDPPAVVVFTACASR